MRVVCTCKKATGVGTADDQRPLTSNLETPFQLMEISGFASGEVCGMERGEALQLPMDTGSSDSGGRDVDDSMAYD